MRATRARRPAPAAWLVLCALLLAGLLWVPLGPRAARAEDGPTTIAPSEPVEAAPSATAPSQPPSTETALLEATPTGEIEATATLTSLAPTEAVPSETAPAVATETPAPPSATFAPAEPFTVTPTPFEPETATLTPTLSLSATASEAATITPSTTASATPSATATATSTVAIQPSTPTATLTATSPPVHTSTPTHSPTPTLLPILAAFPGAVVVNEVVTDPQSDWSGAGFASPPGAGPVSEADAFVELYITASGLNLAGWTLTLDDGSPGSGDLTSGGAFNVARYVGGGSPAYTQAGDYLVLGSPASAVNNTVLITLRDELGALIDQAQLGAGGAPDGAATGPADEAVARVPNGLDTNDDAADFRQQAATPGYANVLGPVPPSPTPGAYAPLAVLINEVAWAGTAANSADEWLELHNPGTAAINLKDWTLTDSGDLAITFPVLVIPPGGYLLLERSSDATVSDLPADLVYTGGLNDGGEALTLRDALGRVIDSANLGGGPWPSGDAALHATMERRSTAADAAGNWQTHTGASQAGHDAGGGPLRGTARAANSGPLPTPAPVPGTTTVLINEFLPRPGAGGQEFVELINLGGLAVDLSGWQLDDGPGGSSPYVLPAGTFIGAGALLAFDQATTGLALNDDGDTVRLLRPDGTSADAWDYPAARAGASWARLPDGGAWSDRGDPSPGQPNRALPDPPEPESVPIGVFRGWNDGAWVTTSAWVSVPPGVFGARTIQIQDGTGGVTVYLGRDDWPPLVVGQPIRLVLGYLRHRGGNLQLYVRNVWHVRPGPAEDAAPRAAWPQRTGVAAGSGLAEATNTYAGALLSVLGQVTRLEAQAFWLDDGSGPVRVFLPSSAGVLRPPVRLGQTWRVTGVVMEVAPNSATNPRYRLQPRFASDLAQMVNGTPVPYVVTPAATVVVEPTDRPED